MSSKKPIRLSKSESSHRHQTQQRPVRRNCWNFFHTRDSCMIKKKGGGRGEEESISFMPHEFLISS